MNRLQPKRILIVLHGSIGDVARALPLVNLVRRQYRDAHLAWSVEAPSLPLVESSPAVDEVILFDRAHWWRESAAFLRRIRSGRFDLVLDLQRHLKSGIISRWSGARIRLGFHRLDAKECNWLFNNHRISAWGDRISKLDHYLKFAEYLGIKPAPVEWNLTLTRAQEDQVKKHLAGVSADFAALFAGSRWESKQWFPSQAAACARMIRDRHGHAVVLLGGADDRAIAAEIAQLAGAPVTNLAGRTTLAEALGIIARAKFAVGPDTGLMHIAAAVGIPVVSLWGATSPVRTGPYGSQELVLQGEAPCVPCYRKRCRIGRICMQSIGLGQIEEKVRMAIARAAEHAAPHAAEI